MTDVSQDLFDAVNSTGPQTPVEEPRDIMSDLLGGDLLSDLALDQLPDDPAVAAPEVEPYHEEEDEDIASTLDDLVQEEPAIVPEATAPVQDNDDFRTAVRGSNHGLRSALKDLETAIGPMDVSELNAYLSRGGFNSNIDPDGSRLRTTIRAMMRRGA